MTDKIVVVCLGVIAVIALLVTTLASDDYDAITLNGVKCISISEGEDSGLYCEPNKCPDISESFWQVVVTPEVTRKASDYKVTLGSE